MFRYGIKNVLKLAASHVTQLSGALEASCSKPPHPAWQRGCEQSPQWVWHPLAADPGMPEQALAFHWRLHSGCASYPGTFPGNTMALRLPCRAPRIARGAGVDISIRKRYQNLRDLGGTELQLVSFLLPWAAKALVMLWGRATGFSMLLLQDHCPPQWWWVPQTPAREPGTPSRALPPHQQNPTIATIPAAPAQGNKTGSFPLGQSLQQPRG